jgi:hypothetical protein
VEALIRASPLTNQARSLLSDRLLNLGPTGEILLGTLECFLRSDGSTSSTARALFVHRNTVTYRLQRIERLTGLGVRTNAERVIWTVTLIAQGRLHILEQLAKPDDPVDSRRTARSKTVPVSAPRSGRGGAP